jgi:hypothetical protein
MSSNSSTGIPERRCASAIAHRPKSKALTSTSDPLRAVPMAVRAAETMTGCFMGAAPW